jgi:hypothetical protein
MTSIYVGIVGFLVWTILVCSLTWEAHTWKDGFEATKTTEERLARIEQGQSAIIKSNTAMAAIRKADNKPCTLPTGASRLLNSPTK